MLRKCTFLKFVKPPLATLRAASCNEPVHLFVCLSVAKIQQELSYRKQITRQLRTQYVEGIHRPKYYTVTLKSRLRVTQGHWKRNHWTDHTRLTISRVI